MRRSKLIDPDTFDELVEDIAFFCPPTRTSDYPISHYLRALLFILKTGCGYRDVLEIFDDVPSGHYTTIHKKFREWAEAKVFSGIYNKLLKIYKEENLNHLEFLDAFIDSTHVRNKNGADLISYGKKDHGKKGNTVSLLVDSSRFPLYFSMDSAKYNDAALIDPIVEDLDKSDVFPPELNVIGDKGYIKKLKKRVGKRNINLVTPRRKNEHRRNTRQEIKKFKKRHVVENVFATLKQYRRISNRYDKKSENYFEYLTFAMIMLQKKVLKKGIQKKSHGKIT
jgi:transposase